MGMMFVQRPQGGFASNATDERGDPEWDVKSGELGLCSAPTGDPASRRAAAARGEDAETGHPWAWSPGTATLGGPLGRADLEGWGPVPL